MSTFEVTFYEQRIVMFEYINLYLSTFLTMSEVLLSVVDRLLSDLDTDLRVHQETLNVRHKMND